MSQAAGVGNSVSRQELQKALLEHNPRVLCMCDDFIRRELQSSGHRSQAGQGSGTANSPGAAVAVERLQKQQTAAMRCSVEEATGAWCNQIAGDADAATAVLAGSLAAIEESLGRLAEMDGGRHAALAMAAKSGIESYGRKTHPLRLAGKTLDLAERTTIMGILNVTPDSFSDGGEFFDEPDAAVERALAMMEEGADIIDVGGESTRPGAMPVAPDEQLRRIVGIVERLARKGAAISIDTSSAEVARAALDAGVAMVNDVTALAGDPAMAPLVAERGVPVVLMHMRGTPLTMALDPRYDNLMSDVARFLRERLLYATDAGIKEENVLLDPGIGFGKTVEHNLELVRRMAELRSIGRPLMVGTSRKSFIGRILNAPVRERMLGAAATLAFAVAAGVSVVRVHDVRQSVQAVRMAEAIMGPRQ